MSGMSDADLKRCADYAAVGITTETHCHAWRVLREGREIGRWANRDDASMFAEELYERIRRIPAVTVTADP